MTQSIFIIKAHYRRNEAAVSIPASNIIHDAFIIDRKLKAHSGKAKIVVNQTIRKAAQGVTHEQLIDAMGANNGLVPVEWVKVIEQFTTIKPLQVSAELFHNAEYYNFFMNLQHAKELQLYVKPKELKLHESLKTN